MSKRPLIPFHLLSKSGKKKRIARLKDNSDPDDVHEQADYDFQSSSPRKTQSIADSEIPSLPPTPNDDNGMNEPKWDDNNHSFTDSDDNVDESGFPSSNLSSYDEQSPECPVELPCTQPDSPSTKLKFFLRDWASAHNTPLTHLSALCAGLKQVHPQCFGNLPVDGRTIMRFSCHFPSRNVPPGRYVHVGLKKQLEKIVPYVPEKIHCLKLIVNIDGLPLYESSYDEVYPILFSIASIKSLKNKVFPVGFWYGRGKPHDLSSFLHDFIEEYNNLYEMGLQVRNRPSIAVEIIGICCDAVAKSYILGTKGHGGFFSCTRCTVRGVTMSRKRVFLESNCPARTHDDFVSRVDTQFRIRDTPLTEIRGLNLVKAIVMDYMHFECLGVMRTLLTLWVSGGKPHQLSWQLKDIVSNKLLELRSCIPKEFVRRPREISFVPRWKATEFRTFMLYLGPLVLKKVLTEEKYHNFLSFHVANTILLDSRLCRIAELRQYARSLLKHFVLSTSKLYGEEFITHNFHGLNHIVDDADYFGDLIEDFCLHDVSAFQFENYLQKVKSSVRGGSHVLEQIANRVAERFHEKLLLPDVMQYPLFSPDTHSNGPLLPFCHNPQYFHAIFKNFKLTLNSPDNCCGLRSGDVVLIHNFACSSEYNEVVIIGKPYLQKTDLYGHPLCRSSDLGIFVVEKLCTFKAWPISDVVIKYVRLRYNNKGDKAFVFPLLNSSN